jgi:GDSL-like Lipase/Acylhydrolase family
MTNRSPNGNRERTSRARYLGFRIAAILLGLLPFAIAEATLRLLDLPARTLVTDPFLDCSQLEPLFKADTDGKHRIPSERLRLFAPAEFSRQKAPNTCRVFSLGESTTQGEPYGPPTAFTAWLGINLQMISPDRNWELVNCGGLSYASYRILPILHEVLDYDPDLIVIYCGQNEFLEDRELSGWKHTPIEVVRAASNLSRLRIIQWATLATKPAPEPNESNPKTRLEREVDALLDSQGGLEKYHRDPLRAEAIVASFRWNLQQMVTACQARNVPLVLIIPTVNLRDCPPFKIEIDPELVEEELQDVESLWRQAHEDREHPDKVRISMQEILRIDARHCGAHYYLGQQAIAEQDWEQARTHLVAAKNYDVCPLRATTAIQEAVREIATKNQVMMLDADDLFQSKSPQRLVGKRWLIDHIHPNIEGHQLLGEALAELLVQSSWLKPSKEIIPATRTTLYRKHISKLGEDYFIRGQQRLEGLLMWTQGRAKQVGVK